jgi:hypothetical protein
MGYWTTEWDNGRRIHHDFRYEDADTIIYESQFMELVATEFDQKYGLVINCVYEAQGAL